MRSSMKSTIILTLAACAYSSGVFAQERLTIPAGTAFLVRTQAEVNSKQNSAGHRFAVTLEHDLVADGEVVARRGSQAYGVISQAQQSRRARGKSKLSLELTSIIVNDQSWPVVTESVQTESKSTTRKTLRRTALGAGIGALADGGDGAATGALIGVGVGVLTKGEQISVPAGTVLQFRLLAPFTP